MLNVSGGRTSYWIGHAPVTDSTLFDIGSITKVVATTSVLARAIDQKKIQLTQTVGELRPEFQGSVFGSMTLQALASHRAGLIAWAPLYLELKERDLVAWFLEKDQKILTQGEVYSDLSLLLLWLAVERQCGNLSLAFEREVVQPLRLKGVVFSPPSQKNIAATEYCLWRKKLLVGEVFDENAAALKQIAPHAGLFSNALSLVPWCEEWLKALKGQSSWLTQETALSFTKKVSKEGTRAIGFDTKSKTGSSLGELFGEQAFGHLGYTGCSVWIDPEKEAFVVLLTNRVHPSRYNDQIRHFRKRVHAEIAFLWGK